MMELIPVKPASQWKPDFPFLPRVSPARPSCAMMATSILAILTQREPRPDPKPTGILGDHPSCTHFQVLPPTVVALSRFSSLSETISNLQDFQNLIDRKSVV